MPEAAKPKPIVWLTFDDGPNSKYTPQVLAVLKKYGAHATFFMIGQNASKNSKIVPKVRAGGHTIGNHSVSHPRLTQLSNSKLRYEVSHGPRSRCFRPPYGLTNSRVSSGRSAASPRHAAHD